MYNILKSIVFTCTGDELSQFKTLQSEKITIKQKYQYQYVWKGPKVNVSVSARSEKPHF